jgi:hypothetical protein
MRQKKALSLLCMILITTSIGSCMRSDISVITPSQEDTATLVTKTETPTVVPSLTFSPSQTSSPLPTSTEISILSEDEARLVLAELLTDNGNCLLPCVWGIIPDKSTIQDVEARLYPISWVAGYSMFETEVGKVGRSNSNYTEGDITIDINVGFITYPANDFISRISFWARALRRIDGGWEDVFDSTAFGEQTAYYRLPQILSTYGRPASVSLITAQPVNAADYAPPNFKIILLYPEQGFLVQYTTDVHVVGENILGCLSNAHVELELYPLGNGDTFISHLDPTWQMHVENYAPLEEATALSVDEFYQTFRQPTDKCLETPVNLWPKVGE